MEKTHYLAGIGLVLKEDKLRGFTDILLKDQLEVHRVCIAEDAEIPKKSKLRNKAQRLEALLAAVQCYEERRSTHTDSATCPTPTDEDADMVDSSMLMWSQASVIKMQSSCASQIPFCAV